MPNADGLTDRRMQSLARELNNSETAFVFEPDGEDHDVRVRFFTPTMEVPTCGHATVAAHYVRAVEGSLPAGTVLQKIGIGILPVDVAIEDDDYVITMTQGPPVISEPLEPGLRSEVLTALGLDDSALDPRCPVQVIDTGNSKVMVGLRYRADLHRLAPDAAALTRLSERLFNRGFFVFTLDTTDPEHHTHARMFGPHFGIPEDPVTGNGHGPLGVYLVHHDLAPHDGCVLEFSGVQGEAMGRRGVARVRVEIQNGRPSVVKVSGSAVIAFQTTMSLPEARP